MANPIPSKDLEKWASFLLNHSLGGIQENDVVMLKGEHIAWPLLSTLQDLIFSAGGLADINLVAPDNNRGQVWSASMARHGTIRQIESVPAWHRQRYEAMTKYIEILGSENPDLFAGLPEEMSAAITRADEPYKNIRLSKPWVLTLYPTPAFAAIEEMSLDDYTRLVVSASTTDPEYLEAVENPLAEALKNGRQIEIVSRDSRNDRQLKLRMDIGERYPVKSYGKRNFPDGEVFTSPNAASVEGSIFFDLPVYYNGVTLEGIFLELKNGVISKYSAVRGEDALRSIIETDEGSHRMGEVAFGMNNGLARALKHPLFVEKVGGTLHMAIGASYPECYVEDPSSPAEKNRLEELHAGGELNRSAQHVDIVLDFRPGGCGKAVYLDGKKMQISDSLWIPPG